MRFIEFILLVFRSFILWVKIYLNELFLYQLTLLESPDLIEEDTILVLVVYQKTYIL